MKAIELEKISVTDMKFFRLFVNTLTSDDKYSLLNRDNLRKPIQIQLSQKQKTFSQFISVFFLSRLSFEYFQKKKMTLIAYAFPKLQTPTNVVNKRLKSPVSEALREATW